MDITATIFRYLSYMTLAAGLVLAFWEMRFGAIAFLCSIAFAHLGSVLRADKHMADMEETLSILINLAMQSRERCEALTGANAQAGGRSGPEAGPPT
jgi:hypothetical protein